MRLPATRRTRAMGLLVLSGLVVLVGLLLYARAMWLYRNIGPLLVAEIERQLGREVAVGRVDVHQPGRVVLERVAVAAEKKLAKGTLFRARRIVLDYSW